MPSEFHRGARAPRLLLVVCLLAAGPAAGGVRTRALPALGRSVEVSLRERAAALAGERIHVLAEVPRAGRRAAERAGVRLLRPAGGDLWLASVPRDAALAPEPPPGVERLFDLRAVDRRAPGLAARLAELGAERRVRLRMKVFRDESLEGVRGLVADLGGRVLFEARRLGVLDAELPARALGPLSARDEVRWVEPAPPPFATANDDMRVDAEVNAVQLLGIDGSGVVLGMWDGGLADTTHPDLAGRVTAGEAGLLVALHPTHVAGIAIGDGTNSLAQGGGGLQWRGVATGASIVGYGAAGAIAEVDSAIALHGIDLSTNSWNYQVSGAQGNCSLYGDYASDAPEFDAIVRGIYGKAIPVVFSAGNERDDGDCGIPARGGYGCLPPPATAKNVITVGAHHSDAGHMTPFSSWGPTDDGRMKPDLSAPGCQVSGDQGITSTTLSGTYGVLCGTSQAAPVVSGSVAALVQEWRARFGADPRPATCKALLGGFAKDRANPGPDYRFGLGAVHLEASVLALRTATTIEDSVAEGAMDAWAFLVPAGQDTLTVTLAWDDPPGAELADPALINDLDLELVAPTAGTFLPFVLDPANPDLPASTGTNRLDNVEQVRVLAPEAGSWTARVIGFSVPQGPQAYSLVGFDARPPADPAAFSATATSDTSVALTWIRPGDADRTGTLLVRSASPITWSPSPGVSYVPGTSPEPGLLVLAEDDVDRSSVPFADEPLAPGTLYHYAVFSHDEIPNYSPGVSDTARTSADAVAAPSPAPAAAGPRFSRLGARPARGPARFRFELPEPARVSVEVYDAAGRRVATLARGEREAGSHAIEWSGRDAAGRPVAAGIYFVRFGTEGFAATEKVVLVR